MDEDEAGRSWGATLRIRVGLHVRQPLKRALKVRSASGEELLVLFIYERLPNFFFLCGHLSHIDKYCEMRFEDGYCGVGEELPYKPWLRAPLLAMVRSQGLSDLRRYPSISSHQQTQPTCTGATITTFRVAKMGRIIQGSRTRGRRRIRLTRSLEVVRRKRSPTWRVRNKW
ncbi:UNVERIFIED_CONTAM: hypothetical protein Sradi_1889300 [Sesamum radiatum]|uniref:Zinc knuckle CX2CX4HX4C domain-containing protein n=1 Tax=Sesamum radiatum TaxID=300843 RepID=A0AAW2TYD3_SESRA